MFGIIFLRAKQSIIRYIIGLTDIFRINSSLKKSRNIWESYAREPSNKVRAYIYSDKEVDEEGFRCSGRDAYYKYVKEDKLLLELLYKKHANKVLDLGCGVGRITEFFKKDFEEVVGIDISEKMIERARERIDGPQFTFLVGDGLRLPIGNSSVDFVFSFIVFQHMPSLDIVTSNIEEVYRVLRSGGVAKIQVRGNKISKSSSFYGVSFKERSARKAFEKFGFKVLKVYHETERYLWVIVEK